MTADPDLAERLYTIGSAYRQAKVLLSAIELDLFSVLAREPLGVEMLAARIGIDWRGARDFFNALLALGLLSRAPDGHYQNTQATDLYLDKAKPTYLGGSFVQYSRREYDMWGSLTDALRTGRPRTEVGNYSHFEAIYDDPIRFRSFVNAMTAGSLLSARLIAEQFPWQGFRTLCDVGTAQGCLPVQVALKHPKIEGMGFDLPELRSAFEQYARDHGVFDRLNVQIRQFLQ
jgi:Dimerisation domain/O-methyltransferase domain